MIFVKLMGGMGNQMFQYATGRNLALRHNVHLKLDLSFLRKQKENSGFTLRNFELDKFKINADIADDNEINNITGKGKLINKLFFHAGNKILPYYKRNVIVEKGISFDKNIFKAPANCMLIGYWQSDRYFKEIENTISADFELANDPDEYSLKILDSILHSNSVSIHFRRGDYVSNENAFKIHGICKLSYYYKAIQIISEKVLNPEFYVFTDDMKWVREYFKIDFPCTYIEGNDKRSEEDLRLMSHCKHNIIANSSFSWWAAWLNQNSDKIVIAPKFWFHGVCSDSTCIVPENWIIVDD